MTPTPTLATRAARAVTYANGARARHKPSRHKAREAIKAVGLEILYDNRRRGIRTKRKHEQALRRQ